MNLSPRPASLALAALIAAGLLVWLAWPEERNLTAAGPSGQQAESAEVASPSETADESSAPTEEPVADSREEAVRAPASGAVPAPNEETNPKTARVGVLVRSKDDGTPLAGLGVAEEVQADTFISRGISFSSTTDSQGHAELEVEPGKPVLLIVEGNGHFVEERELDPLSAGQSVEVVFEFPTREDVHPYGRLVAAESGAPIAGTVTVFRGSKAGRVLTTSPDGHFELSGYSWDSPVARADAESRARATIPIAQGHENPEQPLVVRMSLGATVDFRLQDLSGTAIPSAWIRLRTPANCLQQSFLPLLDSFGDDLTWQTQTDVQGRGTIAQVAPNAPLTVTVFPPELESVEVQEPIRLAPGERRSINLVPGGASTIVGSLLDERGSCLPHCNVWLMPAKFGSRGLFDSYDQPSQSTRTDHAGRFQFEGVTAGTWWIGPAPELKADVPALAEVAIVTDDISELSVVVQVERGLHLRGVVLDAMGVPVRSCTLSVSMIDSDAREYASTDDSGHFEIELPGGRWRVCAFGQGGVHASSPPVEVDASTSDIVLRLRIGGEISGSILDTVARSPSECELGWGRVDRPNDETLAWRMRVSPDGTFCLDHLLPGTYNLIARSRYGTIGIRTGVVVQPGAQIDIGTIDLTAGAIMRLTHSGDAESIPFRICFGGVPIDCGSLEFGQEKTVLVPPGSVEVRWRAIGVATEHVETISVKAGNTREVLLSGS